MESRLDRLEVRRWLAGHREAENVIRRERARELIGRSTDDAWAIYFSLLDSQLGEPPDQNKPSYVLMAMRRVLDRYARRTQPTP
ncbi:MAG: hypothetical protein IT209_07840 [Armatimonadetes bacterium]|nr:hypothetical protein [Armatimonadota bacterium]